METTTPKLKCGGCDKQVAIKASNKLITIEGHQFLANVFVPHLAGGALCYGSGNVAMFTTQAGR